MPRPWPLLSLTEQIQELESSDDEAVKVGDRAGSLEAAVEADPAVAEAVSPAAAPAHKPLAKIEDMVWDDAKTAVYLERHRRQCGVARQSISSLCRC